MKKLKHAGKTKKARLGNAFTFFIIFFGFLAIFLLFKGACNSIKQELLESLMVERHLNDENMILRTEIASITRERFMVLMANERLGLRKAKEEDVYVLR